MKLFGRSGGYWLFWASVVYLCVAVYNVNYPFTSLEIIQLAWLIVLSLPLWISPLARYLNMRTIWQI